MTDKYLDSAAGGSATGDDWTNAYTAYSSVTLTGNTDRLFIASGHSDNSDSTIQGTAAGAGPYMIHISVDKTGSTPPVNADILAGGTLTASVSDWTLNNSVYLEALNIVAVRHFTISGVNETFITKDCTLQVGVDDTFFFGGTSSRILNYNATLSGAGGASDNIGGLDTGTGAGGSIISFFGGQAHATGLAFKASIINGGGTSQLVSFHGFDFTNWGVSTNVQLNNAANNEAHWRFYNCKFPHGATSFGFGTAITAGGGRIECIGCGLVDNTSQEQGLISDQWGDMEVYGGGLASRAVYRNAGAKPPHQANAICWRTTVTSRCGLTNGFALWPMQRYYSTTGSALTITAHYLLGRTAGAVDALDNSQLRMQVEYYDDTGVLYDVEHVFQGVLGTLGGETNHSTSGAAWTTTDAETNTGAYSFAHTTTGTLAQEGFVKVLITVHDIGTNDAVYFCPKLEIN